MSTSTSTPVMSGSMNWEPIQKRLLSSDLNDALKAATELRENIVLVHTTEFPLLLSALLPAFSSVLAHRTRPSPDPNSVEQQLRHLILEIISKMPSNEVLRPHAPHLVAVAMDILNRDYEENALLASRIIFDLYKVYRSLPQDYVQPYLDFVVGSYRALPGAVQWNFSLAALGAVSSPTAATAKPDATTTTTTTTTTTPTSESTATAAKEHDDVAAAAKPIGSSSPSADSSSSQLTPAAASPSRLAVRSNMSFRVLTESPLIVMLMLQLYPSFLKNNIPVMINCMIEALSLRPPPVQALVSQQQPKSFDHNMKRHYFSRARELVAAQAKTLSFITYLLRGFSNELKPHEDRLAANVVALMTTCPRESISTRRELLVATRHLLNSDFRKGFFRHVDALLEERVLMGTHHRFSDQALLRPLAYTTLSDLVQHVRAMLTMTQMSRVVVMFSRVLHDVSTTLPMATQYTAVRTLLSVVDIIYHNKDPNPQVGRDLLVMALRTLVEKLESFVTYFPSVLKEETERELTSQEIPTDATLQSSSAVLSGSPPDTVRDIQIMIRAIVVGQKTIVYYLNGYRAQREKDKSLDAGTAVSSSNEEVSSALSGLTRTEIAIIDSYILTAFPALALLKQESPGQGRQPGEKPLSEQHRDALTYFAAAFTTLDGVNLAKTLGRRLELLVDAIVDDPSVMVVPRHLLGANAAASVEFCSLLLDFLVHRMDDLAIPRSDSVLFFDPPEDVERGEKVVTRELIARLEQRPAVSEERRRQRSTTLLQLFERVLKSLSVFPENETVVRKSLRMIVATCLRSSMEETEAWPDNYCMLLRYVFRSISAGKFEESYRELLPLIPTVLNGLYRVVSNSNDEILRHTAVELCLTIPARLSSLLPHMHLLLRVIIPALDSSSGDLVNLGLRTLEFWVDNLNPVFLYPEMSKQIDLFTSLMQSLSKHLRPAPYPYGLLTLRLLGKLGGQNREFLREPQVLLNSKELLSMKSSIALECEWKFENGAPRVRLPIPLGRCVELLRRISLACIGRLRRRHDTESFDSAQKGLLSWDDRSRLWDESLEPLDFASYSNDVMEKTKDSQAMACFTLLRAAFREASVSLLDQEADLQRLVGIGLMYACLVDVTKPEALEVLRTFGSQGGRKAIRASLIEFLGQPSPRATAFGIEYLRFLMKENIQNPDFLREFLLDLCEASCSRGWCAQPGLQEAIGVLMEGMGREWSREFEVEIMTAGLVAIKSVPRELSYMCVRCFEFFVRICVNLYGCPWEGNEGSLIWDSLTAGDDDIRGTEPGRSVSVLTPNADVVALIITELASSQQLVRFAARFLLTNFFFLEANKGKASARASEQLPLIRKLLFSRSLRLLALPQQVGATEGLAFIVQQLPGLLPLTDQHFVSFVSELLKMCSVADGEMTDTSLKDFVVDKNGFALTASKNLIQTHSSALFFRRLGVVKVSGAAIVVPEELPVGVQMRVSAIRLLDFVIRGSPDTFLDAEVSSSVGNIRPHVISLLFRSLASNPARSVGASYSALKHVLALSTKQSGVEETGIRTHSRLPKELLQTCIRPVLLNLRDYSRLSTALLRGLGRLLSLLTTWFNRTLGEKLLDHLQKWLDPSGIVALKIWPEGDEPLVAAAIIDVFALLPHASQFVEPLVKTCIKLELALPSYKYRCSNSPYQKPLARYLNCHPDQTVAFFFQRLKTPTYSELFQTIIAFEESSPLRAHLSNKKSSVTILNFCFERPLAIIRSEKNTGSTPSSGTTPLQVHGIGSKGSQALLDPASGPGALKAMNDESLELQSQGFRLVQTLLAHDPTYFKDHNDIVRAFRWLWRSKGRFLRLQHEDAVAPRFHSESKILATFLMSYGRSFPNEDFDVLFELVRVFLQPSSSDFGFVRDFLCMTVSQVLTVGQKRHVLDRFFALLAGESTEETKVLSIQFLLFPMLSSHLITSGQPLVDESVLARFVKEVLFPGGSSTSSGDRLKVEILRLCNLFVRFAKIAVEPCRKEVVKFCWNLLKSDDTCCRGWAYVVVCRCIVTFDTPEKIVLQVYAALLRSYQQEGKELIREALDTIVPSLPTKLPSEDCQKAMDQATKMMLEEGNSTPQLAHIGHLIVRNPDAFYPSRNRIAGYMINSLTRVGLPPNSPQESKALALSLVELLLEWHEKDSANDAVLIGAAQADTMANFLIRLKILMAEPSDPRTSRVDTVTGTLETRITTVLSRVVATWECFIKEQPFEKVVTKDRKSAALLLSCLDTLLVLIQAGRKDFVTRNAALLTDLIGLCFRQAKDDHRLRERLRSLVSASCGLKQFSRQMVRSLEGAIVDATHDCGRGRGSDLTSRQARGRDRVASTDWFEYTQYSLELIGELYRQDPDSLRLISVSLLELGNVLTKNHVADASSKQRHGSSSSMKTASSLSRCFTPVSGILLSYCTCDPVEFSRPPQMKPRGYREDSALTPVVRCLLMTLQLFESSDIPLHFTQHRKTFFHILSSLLDSSDSIQLLMLSARTLCKLLLQRDAPLTAKEEHIFFVRLAHFDYSNFPDDASAQPLCDLIALFARRLLESPFGKKSDPEIVLTACLLNASKKTRDEIRASYLYNRSVSRIEGPDSSETTVDLVGDVLDANFEGLGGRFWLVVLVDVLLDSLSCSDDDGILSLRSLVHGDDAVSKLVFESVFVSFWSLCTDEERARVWKQVERLLTQSFNCQLLRQSPEESFTMRSTNTVKSILQVVAQLRPLPTVDPHLLVYLSENYNAWHEALTLLQLQHVAFRESEVGRAALAATRHCYQSLSETGVYLSLASESSALPKTKQAISCDVYSLASEASELYIELATLAGNGSETSSQASRFEMQLWEDRWICLQKELYQREVVSDFAEEAKDPLLLLDCAWKAQAWSKVRSICSSSSLLAEMERGNPIVKISETLLAVADGKLSDVENLHAQSAQLCLNRWQLLPGLASGSPAHASLLHQFHRLVEIRESGQIMVESNNHSKGRTLPDLKNLLNAWRYRLPNDWEPISTWDEIITWRSHMFSAVVTSFQSLCDPNTLAALHDRPWTAIRMAKTARKQGSREVALLVLHKAVEERTMTVPDAFMKLREQVLALYSQDSDVERHGGLNLINTTNLDFFDAAQKSEVFRLKGMFTASLGGRSKANQAYCHSVQIYPTHARAWESWGSLCTSLGAVAEKQGDQSVSGGDDVGKDPKATAKKVAQYLAQGMGCYLEAIRIDTHEWARLNLAKCLWMLTKEGSSPGVMSQTLETRGPQLPPWVWLPWLPQLLTSLYRNEGRAVKTIFAGMAKSYPQAVYYHLRAFYLERRDVERAKGSSSQGQTINSVVFAEELMGLLRRSHASLWSALESVLEELILKFRPMPEEELLTPILALLERAESQVGNYKKDDDQEAVSSSIGKTIGKIAAKFFRPSEPSSGRQDERTKKTAQFKVKYKDEFEDDFHVDSAESSIGSLEGKPPLTLEEIVAKLHHWKSKLEDQVCAKPETLNLVHSSQSLATYAIGDPPDLWPGACDPRHSSRDESYDRETGSSQSTTSSALAARKAAISAAQAASAAAAMEGVGGDYGGGSSFIEIPGQYMPNSSRWSDCRPSPELHPKLLRFSHSVTVLRRNEQLVRKISMLGSDGATYSFLVQSSIPYSTHTDERTAQTNYVMDKVLRKAVPTARTYLSVQPHSVVPMAQRLRLLSEPVSRESLEDVLASACAKDGRDPGLLITKYQDESKRIALETSELGDDEKTETDKAKKLALFRRLAEESFADGSILLSHMLGVLDSPELLYQFRRTFAQQWAANCLLQYAFCVTERSPGRVVFEAATGRVIAHDFRISYGTEGLMVATTVPFRLTSNLANLIGYPLMDGHFAPSMARMALAMKQHRPDTSPIFRLLLRDDMIAYYTRSTPKSDVKTQEMEKQLGDRIMKNVSMVQGKIGECAPALASEGEEPVDKTVRTLVEAARSPENLCMMPASFQGWL